MPEFAFSAEGSRTPATPGPPPPIYDVILAGGIGGSMGDSTMYPLDMIKTRQQGAPSNIKKYSSMMRAAKTIIKEEGITNGVFRGYSAMILGSFPSTMLFFGTYEMLKRELFDKSPLGETVIHLTSGLLGDLASSIIYVPSEVLKARFQLQGPYNNMHFKSGYNYRGLMHAMQTIAREEGWGAFFYGYKATLIRDLPFSALQFAFYEKFHQAATNFRGSRDIGIDLEIGTGAAAGGLAGILTTPLDVIKTRIQTQTDGKISGTFGGLQLVARTEGIAGLFQGVGPRLVWTSVQTSLMFVLYQAALRYLEGERARLVHNNDLS